MVNCYLPETPLLELLETRQGNRASRLLPISQKAMTPSSKNERCDGTGWREGTVPPYPNKCPGCPACRPKDFCGECKKPKCREDIKKNGVCIEPFLIKEVSKNECHGHPTPDTKCGGIPELTSERKVEIDKAIERSFHGHQPKEEKCRTCRTTMLDGWCPYPLCAAYHRSKEAEPTFEIPCSEGGIKHHVGCSHDVQCAVPPTNDQMAREAYKKFEEKFGEKYHGPTVRWICSPEEIEKFFLSLLTTKDRQCKEKVERVVGAVLSVECVDKPSTDSGCFCTEKCWEAARRAAGEGEGV